MEPIEVYLNKNGEVCISQEYSSMEEKHIIALNPSQVDVVIQWLKEVKAEALKVDSES
jgi:Flp pilus assembly CpaF family ATPase